MPSIHQLLNELRQYVGVTQFSSRHQAIVNAYNRILPLPVGYRVTYQDDWCDIFVTYIADKIGLSNQIGRECGVERHRQIMKKKGLWVGKVTPKVGDIIFFDWDGGGFCDHIGYVESVTNTQVVTIEGNANRQVSRCFHALGSPKIVGYARPHYQDYRIGAMAYTVVQEVIQGKWGNGIERIQRLKKAGYDAIRVQQAVNEALAG